MRRAVETLDKRPWPLILVRTADLVGIAALWAACCASRQFPRKDDGKRTAQSEPRLSPSAENASSQRRPRATATIHWQSVPLREAIGRLQPLFDEPVFVDRRVDPSVRVSLDIAATSAEQVVAALAAEQQLGVGRLGKLIYLGPRSAAEQLRATAVAALEGCRPPAGRVALVAHAANSN